MTEAAEMTRGRPGSRRERGEYDRQQRHTAALIQRHYPAWLILYGPWSRKFWAYSTLPAPPGQAIVLSALGPRDLAAQIRDAEIAAATARPAIRPPRQQERGRHSMTPRATLAGPAFAVQPGTRP
jgi:hypothetical protein